MHLLVTPETTDGVTKMLQACGRYYIGYVNHTYRLSGTLWEGRFNSCVIDEENYLLICHRYIELNPERPSSNTPWCHLQYTLNRHV